MRLERHVEVRHPVGTSAERRRNARVTAQVTIWRLLAAGMFMPLVMLTFAASSPSATDDARERVRRYAFEAFPQWAQVHHEEACPRTIAELSPFIAASDAIDPWGTELELRCGDGYRGAYIRSAGPDRRFETSDDVTSND